MLTNSDLMGLFYCYFKSYTSIADTAPEPIPEDFFLFEQIAGIDEVKINPEYFNHNHYECIKVHNNNDLFTLIPEVVVNLRGDANISSSIKDGYWRTIAKALLKGIKNIDKIKVGITLNHNNIHWTSLMCVFAINNEWYKSLKQKFDAEKPVKDYDANCLSYKQHVNVTLNFINKNIPKIDIFDEHTPKLIGVNDFEMTHYDSMGGDKRRLTIFNEAVRTAVKHIKAINNAGLFKGRCGMQKGNTCGDHSVYNILITGLKDENPKEQACDSTFLRNVTQYLLTPTQATPVEEQQQIASHFLGKTIQQITIHTMQHTTVIIDGLVTLAHCWLDLKSAAPIGVLYNKVIEKLINNVCLIEDKLNQAQSPVQLLTQLENIKSVHKTIKEFTDILLFTDIELHDTLSIIHALVSVACDFQYLLKEIVVKLREDFQEKLLADKNNELEQLIGKTNQEINNIEKLISTKHLSKRKRLQPA